MLKDNNIKKALFEFKNDIKKSLQEVKNEIRNELKNILVSSKNEIIHEILKLREDITVVIGYSDRIEDHDQRIEKLETAVYQ